MSHIAISDAGASEPHAPDYCDPKITGAVEEAFEAVWAVIKANDEGVAKPNPIVNGGWKSAERLRS
jgi:hypothetical protein